MNKLEYHLKSGEKRGGGRCLDERKFRQGSAADGPHKAKHVFTKIGWQFHLQGTVIDASSLFGFEWRCT